MLGVNRWEEKSMLYADAKAEKGRPNRPSGAEDLCDDKVITKTIVLFYVVN